MINMTSAFDIEHLLAENERLLRRIEELSAEMDAAHYRAEQAERLKVEFLATMSHELRTPLHVILGFSELMLEMSQEPLTNLQTAYVRRIFQSGKHLLGLINSVIEVARLEAGDVTLEYTTFATSAWYHEVIEHIAPLVSEKNLAFVAKLDSRMPPTMTGDSKYLFDMACGLLTNAIKYTEHGKVNFEIRRVTTQSWIIEVADTGIGIAEEDQQYIFDLFRQADGSYSRKHGGLGIGLNLVRSLTAMMGGHITLESRLGLGSTFRVTLPLTEDKQRTNKPLRP